MLPLRVGSLHVPMTWNSLDAGVFSICCLEGQDNADDRGAGDVDDGMELELLDGGKGQDEEDQLLEIKEIQQGTGLLIKVHVEHGDLHHADAGSGNEAGDSRTQSVEGGIHQLAAPESVQGFGDQDDDDDGGQNFTHGGDHAAEESGHVAAYIGGHVDADGAGGGFGNGDHVRDEGLGVPPGGLRQILQEGQRGHAAAHGEETNFQKFPKEL